jgi:hypothetical protein
MIDSESKHTFIWDPDDSHNTGIVDDVGWDATCDRTFTIKSMKPFRET